MRSQQPVEAEEEAQVDCSIGPHGYWGLEETSGGWQSGRLYGCTLTSEVQPQYSQLSQYL